MYFYNAYYLNIASEIELPEFPVGESTATPDVQITLGKTPENLVGNNIVEKVFTQRTSTEFLFKMLDFGRVYVVKGKKIIIEPDATANWGLIKNYIRNKGLAAIIHQRGWGLLHGSAVKVNDKAVLFIGRSGAGKSTTAGAFLEKGYQLISDDLCLIKQHKDNAYHLYPAYPQIRLWEHAIDLLEAPSLKKGGAIRKGVDKYYMSPATDLVDTPVKISHIYVLNPQNGTSKTVDIQAINYFDGLQLIMEHTHAKGHIIDAKSQKAQFKRLSYLVQTATIKEVKRPLGMKKDKFWDMINLIEQDFLA